MSFHGIENAQNMDKNNVPVPKGRLPSRAGQKREGKGKTRTVHVESHGLKLHTRETSEDTCEVSMAY